jgi:phosphoribosylformimino-5-aminoimidazole carboxamide ribotide isomerase
MELIPAIDIRGGRCVRLDQGDFGRETVFADEPVEVARRWLDEGASRLHVVDLDGAREGWPVNAELVGRIVAVAGVPVQVGGGLRDKAAIQRYLDAGVDRVVLGTAAVKDRALLAEALAEHGRQIVVSVDARVGLVAVEGWEEETRLAAAELMSELVALGVPRFVYTDTLRDGTLQGPDLAAIEGLAARVSVPVIYAGGVSSIDDLVQLAPLGLEGAIVGKALYTGDVILREALEVLGQATRPRRGFSA